MKALALFAALLLGACAPQLEGVYTDAEGSSAFRLTHGQYFRTNPDGSYFLTQRAGQHPLPRPHPYKVDGRIVIVAQGPDRAEFEILPDGRLKLSQGGQALFFVRK
jgi:hypothetical protein